MLQTPILTPGAKGVGFYWSRASVSSFKLGLPEVRVYVSSSHGQFLKDRGCDTNSPKRFPGRGGLAGGRGTTDGPHPHSFRPRTRPPPNLPAKGEPAGARGFLWPTHQPTNILCSQPCTRAAEASTYVREGEARPCSPTGTVLGPARTILGVCPNSACSLGSMGKG